MTVVSRRRSASAASPAHGQPYYPSRASTSSSSPPTMSFAATDTQYFFTFALMLAVAVVISQLAARMRSGQSGPRRRARGIHAGPHRPRPVQRYKGRTGRIDMPGRHPPLIGAQVVLLIPNEKDSLVTSRGTGPVDLSVAQWASTMPRRRALGTHEPAERRRCPVPATEGFDGDSRRARHPASR